MGKRGKTHKGSQTDRVTVASTDTQTTKASLVDCSTQTDPTDAVNGAAAVANAAKVEPSAPSVASAALIKSMAFSHADLSADTSLSLDMIRLRNTIRRYSNEVAFPVRT